jgi:hypothetical protein
MSSNDNHAPVRMIQWGPVTEPDELPEIWRLLGGRVSQRLQPASLRSRVTNGDAQAFLDKLDEILRSETPENRQVVYLSAHGNPTHFGFNNSVALTYEQLGQALASALEGADHVTAVFGSCKALADESRLLNTLPTAISVVYGFVSSPTAGDVARLMATVLEDDVRLWVQLHRANKAVYGEGVTGEANIKAAVAELAAKLDMVLDNFHPDPARFIEGGGGTAVQVAKRVKDGWSLKTYSLAP